MQPGDNQTFPSIGLHQQLLLARASRYSHAYSPISPVTLGLLGVA